MLKTPINMVKSLAAVIWLAGAIILFIKSSSLLGEAEKLHPEKPWIWIALLTSLVIGAIKTKFLFRRLCYKNLSRIDKLYNAKIWQCYRPQFFIFLFLMVSLGTYMSRLAEGNYMMLISVAIVDLSIATALLGSSICFWKKQ